MPIFPWIRHSAWALALDFCKNFGQEMKFSPIFFGIWNPFLGFDFKPGFRVWYLNPGLGFRVWVLQSLVPKLPLLAPIKFNQEIATFRQILPQNRHFFGHISAENLVLVCWINRNFSANKRAKNRQFLPKNLQFFAHNRHDLAAPPKLPKSPLFASRIATKICPYWSFKIATLARNRLNWRPWSSSFVLFSKTSATRA